MVFQVVVVQHLMNEPSLTGPTILREWLRQSQVPLKAAELSLERVKMVNVERLSQATRTVPERYLTRRVQPIALVKEVGPHRCHPSATTNENHLRLSVLSKKLTKRSRDNNLVTRFDAKKV